MAKPRSAPRTPEMRILSSAHLAAGELPHLSEFEFGLIVSGNAFGRWVVRCMGAAGGPELTLTDSLVLHHVHHRDRSKRLADICFTLNYEDTHVVNYALKKLIGLGLLSSEKLGKEVAYATTPAGRTLLERYREVRERCLLPGVSGGSGISCGSADPDELGRIAQELRRLSGVYDQAARAAASL